MVRTARCSLSDAWVVYSLIDVNVYRKSTGRDLPTRQMRGFCGDPKYRAYYHQQYLAKSPRGYCPDHSCGVSFDSAGS
jgi:hypothetical protein